VTDEALLGSDESTLSPNEGRNPPYQSSNLSNSASSDDDDDETMEGQEVTESHHPSLFSLHV
jgi:hypothetical protein